jgi:hypothetical protein
LRNVELALAVTMWLRPLRGNTGHWATVCDTPALLLSARAHGVTAAPPFASCAESPVIYTAILPATAFAAVFTGCSAVNGLLSSNRCCYGGNESGSLGFRML